MRFPQSRQQSLVLGVGLLCLLFLLRAWKDSESDISPAFVRVFGYGFEIRSSQSSVYVDWWNRPVGSGWDFTLHPRRDAPPSSGLPELFPGIHLGSTVQKGMIFRQLRLPYWFLTSIFLAGWAGCLVLLRRKTRAEARAPFRNTKKAAHRDGGLES